MVQRLRTGDCQVKYIAVLCQIQVFKRSIVPPDQEHIEYLLLYLPFTNQKHLFLVWIKLQFVNLHAAITDARHLFRSKTASDLYGKER